MKIKNLVAVGLVLSMSACASQNGQYSGGSAYMNKENVGTVLGGVGGAVAGSQFGKGKGQLVGVAAGTLLGAVLGNQIGASLDRADMTYYNQSSQRALESGKSGQPVTWVNPDSGNSGTIIPTKTYQTATGDYCREYNQTVSVGGKTQKAYGTACRMPDGTWQIQQ